ncbi:MAG: DUF3380 domain-containing protein, partial [Aureispira sp.]|nr:DUF3380 domain-containing protein [Aureispira sp.]
EMWRQLGFDDDKIAQLNLDDGANMSQEMLLEIFKSSNLGNKVVTLMEEVLAESPIFAKFKGQDKETVKSGLMLAMGPLGKILQVLIWLSNKWVNLPRKFKAPLLFVLGRIVKSIPSEITKFDDDSFWSSMNGIIDKFSEWWTATQQSTLNTLVQEDASLDPGTFTKLLKDTETVIDYVAKLISKLVGDEGLEALDIEKIKDEFMADRETAMQDLFSDQENAKNSDTLLNVKLGDTFGLKVFNVALNENAELEEIDTEEAKNSHYTKIKEEGEGWFSNQWDKFKKSYGMSVVSPAVSAGMDIYNWFTDEGEETEVEETPYGSEGLYADIAFFLKLFGKIYGVNSELVGNSGDRDQSGETSENIKLLMKFDGGFTVTYEGQPGLGILKGEKAVQDMIGIKDLYLTQLGVGNEGVDSVGLSLGEFFVGKKDRTGIASLVVNNLTGLFQRGEGYTLGAEKSMLQILKWYGLLSDVQLKLLEDGSFEELTVGEFTPSGDHPISLKGITVNNQEISIKKGHAEIGQMIDALKENNPSLQLILEDFKYPYGGVPEGSAKIQTDDPVNIVKDMIWLTGVDGNPLYMRVGYMDQQWFGDGEGQLNLDFGEDAGNNFQGRFPANIKFSDGRFEFDLHDASFEADIFGAHLTSEGIGYSSSSGIVSFAKTNLNIPIGEGNGVDVVVNNLVYTPNEGFNFDQIAATLPQMDIYGGLRTTEDTVLNITKEEGVYTANLSSGIAYETDGLTVTAAGDITLSGGNGQETQFGGNLTDVGVETEIFDFNIAEASFSKEEGLHIPTATIDFAALAENDDDGESATALGKYISEFDPNVLQFLSNFAVTAHDITFRRGEGLKIEKVDFEFKANPLRFNMLGLQGYLDVEKQQGELKGNKEFSLEQMGITGLMPKIPIPIVPPWLMASIGIGLSGGLNMGFDLKFGRDEQNGENIWGASGSASMVGGLGLGVKGSLDVGIPGIIGASAGIEAKAQAMAGAGAAISGALKYDKDKGRLVAHEPLAFDYRILAKAVASVNVFIDVNLLMFKIPLFHHTLKEWELGELDLSNRLSASEDGQSVNPVEMGKAPGMDGKKGALGNIALTLAKAFKDFRTKEIMNVDKFKKDEEKFEERKKDHPEEAKWLDDVVRDLGEYHNASDETMKMEEFNSLIRTVRAYRDSKSWYNSEWGPIKKLQRQLKKMKGPQETALEYESKVLKAPAPKVEDVGPVDESAAEEEDLVLMDAQVAEVSEDTLLGQGMADATNNNVTVDTTGLDKKGAEVPVSAGGDVKALTKKIANTSNESGGVVLGGIYQMKDLDSKHAEQALKSVGMSHEQARELSKTAGATGKNALLIWAGIDEEYHTLDKKMVDRLMVKEYNVIRARLKRKMRNIAVKKSYRTTNLDAVNPAIVQLLIDLEAAGDYTPKTRRLIQYFVTENDLKGLLRIMKKPRWVTEFKVPDARYQRRIEFLKEAWIKDKQAKRMKERLTTDDVPSVGEFAEVNMEEKGPEVAIPMEKIAKQGNEQIDTGNLSIIRGSVGKDGANSNKDTMLVQGLLKKVGYELKVDGIAGRNTKGKIMEFQMFKGLVPTGLVKPGSATLKLLQELPQNAVNTSRATGNTIYDMVEEQGMDQGENDEQTQNEEDVVDLVETANSESEVLSTTSKIESSVGGTGKNKPADVKAVKALLNLYGHNFELNGVADDSLTAAIKKFQTEYLGSKNPDGRVDAGGKTWNNLLGIGRIRADLVNLGKKYGVEPAVILCIQSIESGGNGFFSDGRPKILFEGHIFWSQLKKAGKKPEDHEAGNEDILYPKWDKTKYAGGKGEYNRLEKAKKIHKSAALKSASWGEFQIMGFNHATVGYNDVESFVEAMHVAGSNQLDAVMEFVKKNNLLRHVQGDAKNWAAFAKGYNGPAYAKNQYDKKLAAAYERFSKLKF